MIRQLRLNKESYIAYLLSTILVFITLPKAGMVAWIPLTLTLIMISALILYLKENFQSDLTTEDKAWLSVWLAYCVVTLLQLFIIPGLVNWNSPLHSIPGLELAHHPANSTAIYESWILFTCYWSFAFLASKLPWGQIKICLYSICAALTFQVIYGVFADLLGQQSIIGIWPKEYYLGSTTGTFVNHNHYANYIAVALPLVLSFCYLRAEKCVQYRQTSGALMAAFFTVMLLAFSIFALISSQSRAGAAIGGVGIVSTFFFLVTQRVKPPLILKLAIIFAIILLGLMLANFIGLGDILARYQRSLGYDMRWEVWPTIFELPTSMLILGAGAGSFFDVFLLVHPPTTPKTAYYAHNDYLQFLVEYGVLGIAILITASRKLIRLYFDQRKPGAHPLKTACAISILLMAIHSLIDFSLHRPANALLFWFSLGLLLNPNIHSGRVKVTKKRQKKQPEIRISLSGQ